MEHKNASMPQSTDPRVIRTMDDIAKRIRELTAQIVDTPSEERNEEVITEIEVLAAAAFLDPVASTSRGEMSLSRALVAFSNSPTSDFKRDFVVGDYGRDFDQAYGLARKVVGNNVAFDLMEDVLTKTGDPSKASILVIERMISPDSPYHKFARPPATHSELPSALA